MDCVFRYIPKFCLFYTSILHIADQWANGWPEIERRDAKGAKSDRVGVDAISCGDSSLLLLISFLLDLQKVATKLLHEGKYRAVHTIMLRA